MGNECRFNIFPGDPSVIQGISLLMDFISGFNVSVKSRRGIDIDKVSGLARKLSDEHYIFLVSLSTLINTNLLEQWDGYRDKLENWLRDFIKTYCLDVGIDDLPSNYRARIALDFLILLAKDVIENHLKELPSEERKLFTEKPVITWMGVSLNLVDVISILYPTILSALTSGAISYGTEPVRLAGQYSGNIKSLLEKTATEGRKGGQPYRVYKLIYLPLISAGVASEYMTPEILELSEGFKYRFTITGMGHNFANSMVFILSQSLNRVYYEYVLNNLVGINHAFQTFIQYYLPNIFSVDVYSVARGLIDEYLKYVKTNVGINRYFTYNISDALKDISTTTLALLSQYYELQNHDELRHRIPNDYINEFTKYLPFITYRVPVKDMIKEAIKRLWLYSYVNY